MSFLPLVAIWVVLVIAAAALVPARRRPLRLAIVVIALGLSLVAWWIARSNAPAVSTPWLGGQWSVGGVAWQLTGVILLLLAMSVAQALTDQEQESATFDPVRALALSAAALPVVWAADGRTQVATTALFVVVWAAVEYAWAARAATTLVQSFRPALWLAAAVFLRWLAVLPGDSGGLAGLAAAALLLGLWPIDGWRGVIPHGRPGLATLLIGLPVVAGAAALAPFAGSAASSPMLFIVATVVALLGLLGGLARVDPVSPVGVARPLAAMSAAVVLLAGVWAGDGALLPATRLAVFAPALLLAIGRTSATEGSGGLTRPRVVRLAVLLLVFLATAGFPLTVGFAVLSRLYGAWWAAGGYVLLGVTAFLIALWLAALVAAGRLGSFVTPGVDRRWVMGLLPLALAALGLIHWDAAFIDTPLLIWIVLFGTALAGAAVGWFAPRLGAPADLLRQSFTPALPAERVVGRARLAGSVLAAALSDAAALMEGKNGLLFVLGFLLLLLLVGR